MTSYLTVYTKFINGEPKSWAGPTIKASSQSDLRYMVFMLREHFLGLYVVGVYVEYGERVVGGLN